MPLSDVWSALFDRGESLNDALVFDIRLPRAAAGIVAGFALAGAAVVLQAITRNPLAEPATLGLSAGGALTVTLVAAYASLAPGAPTIAVAFVGVALGTALIGAMAAAGGGGIRLILAGMAVGLALAAGSAAVRLARETETSGLFLWGAGSLLQNGWGPLQAGVADRHARAARRPAAHPLARRRGAGGEHGARARPQLDRFTQIAAVTLAAVLTAVAVGPRRPDRVRRHPRRRPRPRGAAARATSARSRSRCRGAPRSCSPPTSPAAPSPAWTPRRPRASCAR